MFEENSTICFLGDSITADGRWIYELNEFFKENKRKLRLFNCGIAGGTVCATYERLETDCFNFNPDTVVCMFGLNDIIYPLYGDRYYFSYEERTKAIEAFEKGLDKLILEMKNRGIGIILITPPPYGEWVESKEENLYHANKGVALLLEIYKRASEKHGVPLVDVNSLFMKYIKKDRLINADRLHPTAPGHHLISQAFLKAFGFVSEINRDYPLVRSKKNTERYEIEQILRGIIFTEWHILKEFKECPKEVIRKKAEEEIKKYKEGEFFYSQLKLYTDNIERLNELYSVLEIKTDEFIKE